MKIHFSLAGFRNAPARLKPLFEANQIDFASPLRADGSINGGIETDLMQSNLYETYSAIIHLIRYILYYLHLAQRVDEKEGSIDYV